jgi:hypothetical protein
MKLLFTLALLFISFHSFAENTFSLEIGINSLDYKRPAKGVGAAGSLKFENVNLNNNGIVLNLKNTNNNFDAQIFTRPTFLGFTNSFGNFGLEIEEHSVLNSVKLSKVENTFLILDESQLNVSGTSAMLVNSESTINLKNFRLYCQGQTISPSLVNPTNDILRNCFSFLIFNGSINPTNDSAELEYAGINQGDKNYFKGNIRSVDLRKKDILLDLKSANLVSNDTYVIKSENVQLKCAKDEDLVEFDLEKIKKTCFNDLKISPLKATLTDNLNKTNFFLDLTNAQIVNKVIYLALKAATISDSASSTFLTNTVLNCKKELDTDVLNLPDVISDCLSMGKISIAEVKSTKNIDINSKDSSVKNIIINSNQNILVAEADIKFLGLKHRVAITTKASMNLANRELSLTVTDVKLPFGISSVKLLMYFLKKMIVSKDIVISGNVIKIIF